MTSTGEKISQQDTVLYASMTDGLSVVRIVGRGTMHNSAELKCLAEYFGKMSPPPAQIVIDLGKCTTMDSTFLGVMASIGLRHRKITGTPVHVVNANQQTLRLLQTLGLSHFMDVRASAVGEVSRVADEEFQKAPCSEMGRVDRIIHMIEAHQTLVEADSENAVRFESVLKCLNESLEREKNP